MARKKSPRRIRDRSTVIFYALLILSAVSAILSVQAFVLAKPDTQSTAAINKISNSSDVISVPVPTERVAVGTLVRDIKFTNVDWPRGESNSRYLLSLRAMPLAKTTTALPPFVPIPVSSLSEAPLSADGLAERIPEGMRAITVTVNEETAIEGWAQSGSSVDVIAITTSSDNTGLEARVIAENVRILSAGRSLNPSTPGTGVAPKAPNTVTLLCQQEDALKIKMAAKVGSITFSLRGNVDDDPTQSTALTQQKLFGSARPSSARYVGEVTGPDGAVYTLRKDSNSWVKKEHSLVVAGKTKE